MGFLQQQKIDCPYCGEVIEVLIESGEGQEQYIEDCQVCCRPITFVVADGSGGEPLVTVYAENDVF